LVKGVEDFGSGLVDGADDGVASFSEAADDTHDGESVGGGETCKTYNDERKKDRKKKIFIMTIVKKKNSSEELDKNTLPEVGSSNINTEGELNNSIAMVNLRFSPPEMPGIIGPPTLVSAVLVNPSSERMVSILSCFCWRVKE
jgi:hypothetical protein